MIKKIFKVSQDANTSAKARALGLPLMRIEYPGATRSLSDFDFLYDQTEEDNIFKRLQKMGSTHWGGNIAELENLFFIGEVEQYKNDFLFGLFSPEEFAKKLAVGLTAKQRKLVDKIYLGEEMLAVSLDESKNPSFAQLFVNELVKLGFAPTLSVHVITTGEDILELDVRIQEVMDLEENTFLANETLEQRNARIKNAAVSVQLKETEKKVEEAVVIKPVVIPEPIIKANLPKPPLAPIVSKPPVSQNEEPKKTETTIAESSKPLTPKKEQPFVPVPQTTGFYSSLSISSTLSQRSYAIGDTASQSISSNSSNSNNINDINYGAPVPVTKPQVPVIPSLTHSNSNSLSSFAVPAYDEHKEGESESKHSVASSTNPFYEDLSNPFSSFSELPEPEPQFSSLSGSNFYPQRRDSVPALNSPLPENLLARIADLTQLLKAEIASLERRSSSCCFTFFVNYEITTKKAKLNVLEKLVEPNANLLGEAVLPGLGEISYQVGRALEDSRITRAGRNTCTGKSGESRVRDLLLDIDDHLGAPSRQYRQNGL